jgi:peptidoglycan/LPS O-acetylase OafA/YrhL
MQVEIPGLYFALLALSMAFINLPLFRRLDATPGTTLRYGTLDGLRGFLALSVFAFHLIVTREFLVTDVWQPPHSRFYRLLGPLGVSLFFMITGFLFWSKLLAVRGRGRWRELYLGRLFRIAPMYLFAVLGMLLVVYARTGFELRAPLGASIIAIAQWLALGIGNFQPDVNGAAATHVLAGVTWTISYEWAFYASLLGTAFFARNAGHLAFVVVALVLAIAGKVLLASEMCGFAALFSSGMLVASLLHAGRVFRFSDAVGSSLGLGCLTAIFLAAWFSDRIQGYGTPALLAFGVFFYLVASGTTLFGLFTTRAAQRLGNISYSVYLLQGLALVAVYWNEPLRSTALSGPGAFWLLGGACGILLVSASALTYVCVELPGIRLGRECMKRRSPAPAETRTVRGVPCPPALDSSQ